jgi:predicted NACHT family NTPase
MLDFITPKCTNEVDTAVFTSYMENAKEKYGTIKTLFYMKSPKPFYELYVPNRIEHSSSRSNKILENITVKSLIAISNFLIIGGAGGLGKSMMMRHLLLNSIGDYSNFRHVPVFMSVKDYTSVNLSDFIYSRITMLKGNDNTTKEVFQSSLTEGLFLLLFDGLDEIGDEHGQHFEEQLESFADKYPKNLFVISSRPYRSFISFSRFTVLNIMPFNLKQALQLVDKLDYRPDEPDLKPIFADV